MYDIFIARQAIFDKKMEVFGYELLARDSGESNHNEISPELATIKTLMNVFADMGLNQIVNDSLAFINLAQENFYEGVLDNLPKKRVVFELSESLQVDQHIKEEVARLRERGARFALDRYQGSSQPHHELINYCDIVKIDVNEIGVEALSALVSALENKRVKLLAQRIETPEQMEQCKSLGFDLFQGRFLCEPSTLKGNGVASSKAIVLRLLSDLQNPDATIEGLEKIISYEVTLSYKLLRYLNSASLMLRKKIESVHTAVILIGIDQIRNWASIIAMSQVEDKPSELITLSLVRARMCELLAKRMKKEKTDSFFLTGLFSTLDALLDMPMEEIVNSLHLADDVSQGLRERRGEQGKVLDLVLAYEEANWARMDMIKRGKQLLSSLYLESISWADNMYNDLIGED